MLSFIASFICNTTQPINCFDLKSIRRSIYTYFPRIKTQSNHHSPCLLLSSSSDLTSISGDKMVVHSGLPGISVEIIVRGHALQEFEDPGTNEGSASPRTVFNSGEEFFKSVSKFIKSEAGEEFSIKCSIGKPFTCESDMLGIDIYINNKSRVRKFITKSALQAKDPFLSKTSGVRTIEDEKMVFRPFKFVDIKRSEFCSSHFQVSLC